MKKLLAFCLMILLAGGGSVMTIDTNAFSGNALSQVVPTTKKVSRGIYRKGRRVTVTTWKHGKKITKRVWRKGHSIGGKVGSKSKEIVMGKDRKRP